MFEMNKCEVHILLVHEIIVFVFYNETLLPYIILN